MCFKVVLLCMDATPSGVQMTSLLTDASLRVLPVRKEWEEAGKAAIEEA